jgi:hypothetical protein
LVLQSRLLLPDEEVVERAGRDRPAAGVDRRADEICFEVVELEHSSPRRELDGAFHMGRATPVELDDHESSALRLHRRLDSRTLEPIREDRDGMIEIGVSNLPVSDGERAQRQLPRGVRRSSARGDGEREQQGEQPDPEH